MRGRREEEPQETVCKKHSTETRNGVVKKAEARNRQAATYQSLIMGMMMGRMQTSGLSNECCTTILVLTSWFELTANMKTALELLMIV
jgi:hypothetical protein